MLARKREKRRRMLKVRAPRITTVPGYWFRGFNRQVTRFTLEKRPGFLGLSSFHWRLANLALLAGLLAACGPTGVDAASPTATLKTIPTVEATKSPTAIFTATETPNPVSSLDPKVQELFKSQNVAYEVGTNGSFQIDLYDSPKKETIELASFSRVDTQDGLNPNILTAVDKENNNYAYNPDQGWFQVPKVQTNPEKLDEYTEVTEDFFTDGRANITTALQYAENPTISPDAIYPHYWANFGADGGSYFMYLSFRPSGDIGHAQTLWPDLFNSSDYTEETKPFAWTGFYKVPLNTGETIFVDSRTAKNPIDQNKNQLINLFYGFDEATYKHYSTTLNALGQTVLSEFLNNTDWDFVGIMPSPNEIDGLPMPWDPDKVHRGPNFPNPNVANLQNRGELISLFDQTDENNILDILYKEYSDSSPSSVVPVSNVPKDFSKYILLTGLMR